MISIGLDLGTGFVKCTSDFGKIRFPSLYASKTVTGFSSGKQEISEFIGWNATKKIGQKNVVLISPIKKGRPLERYQDYIALLVQAAIKQSFSLNKSISTSDKISLCVGMPFHGKRDVPFLKKSVERLIHPEILSVVPQAFGTLIDVNMKSGLVVNIGQGTTELVVFDNGIPTDGKSILISSSMITEEISEFAYLKPSELEKNKTLCEKFSKQLVDSLYNPIMDFVEEYGLQNNIILAGGGILIPGVKQNFLNSLKNYTVKIPTDPSFSNSNGLFKTAKLKSKKV